MRSAKWNAAGWLLTLALPTLVSAQTARIFGRVRDKESGKPITGAAVLVGGRDSVSVTGPTGSFSVVLPPGVHRLHLTALGYLERTDSIVIQPAASMVDVEVMLSRKPVVLPPVEVTARSERLIRAGFYDRREGGLAPPTHFMTRADIEHRQPTLLTDLFQDVPQVKVLFIEAGRRTLRFNRHVSTQSIGEKSSRGVLQRPDDGADSRGCEPDLYIDGQLYRDSSIPANPSGDVRIDAMRPRMNKVDNYDAIPVSEVEGVEVYVGAATPLQYHNACGVILIWTR